MNTRFTLGAALVAAGVFAVPSFASAATTCNYDATKRQVNIQLANPTFGGQTAILRAPGDYIKVADNNELPRSCFIPGFTDDDHAAIVAGHQQDPGQGVAELRAPRSSASVTARSRRARSLNARMAAGTTSCSRS